MNTLEKTKNTDISKAKSFEKRGPALAKKDLSKKGLAPKADSGQGLKYRLLFLTDQLFKSKSYFAGEELEVSEDIFQAYKGRSTLKFEQVNTN